MRLIGLMLGLAAIGWLLFSAADGDDSEGVIPEGYQQSLKKAEGVEKTVQEAAQRSLQDLEKQKP